MECQDIWLNDVENESRDFIGYFVAGGLKITMVNVADEFVIDFGSIPPNRHAKLMISDEIKEIADFIAVKIQF